jgi:phage gp46-like protein
MSDIATIWDVANGQGDWQLSPPVLHAILDSDGGAILDSGAQLLLDAATVYTPGDGLLAGGDLQTAVLISLFTDATASSDDIIPDGTGDPRGWWGDRASPIGSKIWLRLRAKRTPAVLDLVKNDIQQALQWMIDDGVAAQIDVVTEFQGTNRLAASVVIYRQSGSRHPMNFDWAWKGE